LSNGAGSGFTEPYCVWYGNNFALWKAVAFFYVPYLLCLAIATGSIVAVGVQFLRVSDPTSAFHIRNNLRLLAYLLCSLIGGVFFVSYRLYYGTGTGTVDSLTVSALQQYSRCSQASPDCVQNIVHNQGFVFLFFFFNYVAPIVVCVMFLLQKELWTVPLADRILPWRAFMVCFVQGPDDSGSTSTTAGSSSSSGTSGSGSDTFVSDLS
jgi:hypothetical protein